MSEVERGSRKKRIPLGEYNPQEAADGGIVYSQHLEIPVVTEASSGLVITKLLFADGTFAIFNVRHPDFADNYQQIQVNMRWGEELILLVQEGATDDSPPAELLQSWYIHHIRPDLAAQFPEVFAKIIEFHNMVIPRELTALARKREDLAISEWCEVAHAWNDTKRKFIYALISLNGFYQKSEMLDWVEQLDDNTPSGEEVEVMSTLCLSFFAQQRLKKALEHIEADGTKD